MKKMSKFLSVTLALVMVMLTTPVTPALASSANFPETTGTEAFTGGISITDYFKRNTDSGESASVATFENNKLEYEGNSTATEAFIMDVRSFKGATRRLGTLTYNFKFGAPSAAISASTGESTTNSAKGLGTPGFTLTTAGGVTFNGTTITGTKTDDMYEVTLEYNFNTETVTASMAGGNTTVSRAMTDDELSGDDTVTPFRFLLRAGKDVTWSIDDATVTYNEAFADAATTVLTFDEETLSLPSWMTYASTCEAVDVDASLEEGESAGNASGKVLKLSHNSETASGKSLKVDLNAAIPTASGRAGIMTYEFDYNTEGGAAPGVKINGNDYKIAQLNAASIDYLTSEGDATVHLESSGVGVRKGNTSADHISGWNHVKLVLNYSNGEIYTQVNNGDIKRGIFDTTQSSIDFTIREAVSTTKVWYLDNFQATFVTVQSMLDTFKETVKVPTSTLHSGMIALPGDSYKNIKMTVVNSTDESIIPNGVVTNSTDVADKKFNHIEIKHPETETTVKFKVELSVEEKSITNTAVTSELSVTVAPKRAVEIYNAKVSDGKLATVTMNKNTAASAKVFAAAYNGNVLSNAVVFDAATKTESLNLTVGSGEEVKFFVWDSESGLKPLQTVVENAQKPTLHILAASTYAEEPASLIEAEQAGIGLKLKDYFDTDKMPINNKAVCGWSTHDFSTSLSSGDYRLNSVLRTIEVGDYVIVSFNHNDQKVMDLGTDGAPTYSAYLTRFVNEIRSKGATPILITAIPRLIFSDSTFEGNNDTHVRFNTAMKSVASATACDIVDLNSWFTAEITEAGYDTAKAWFDVENNDTTHLSHAGATKCANWLGAELVELYPALAGFVK